jgi:hypothetical protein
MKVQYWQKNGLLDHRLTGYFVSCNWVQVVATVLKEFNLETYILESEACAWNQGYLLMLQTPFPSQWEGFPPKIYKSEFIPPTFCSLKRKPCLELAGEVAGRVKKNHLPLGWMKSRFCTLQRKPEVYHLHRTKILWPIVTLHLGEAYGLWQGQKMGKEVLPTTFKSF